MKISKVNHRRTAVSVNTVTKPADGILYTAPMKTGRDGKPRPAMEKADDVVSELVQNSSRLYSPFNSGKSQICDKDLRKEASSLKKCYSSFVKFYAKDAALDEEKKQFRPAANYSNNPKVRMTISSPDKVQTVIDAVVDSALRKSLKRNVVVKTADGKEKTAALPDLVKKSIKIYCLDRPRKLQPEEMAEMYALFSYIVEDRDKNKQSKQIVKSIENQNTKVMVADTDGDKLLQLSVADSRKKPVWDFAVEYANADPEGQQEMLRTIRKWIVLFVCGSDVYQQIAQKSDLNLWSFEGYGIPADQLFVSLENCCSDKSEEIPPEEIRRQNMEHYREAVKTVDSAGSRFWFQHFENAVETLFSQKRKRKVDRAQSVSLCEYLWKDFFSYAATKYIDLGKGVYHFAMADKLESVQKNESTTPVDFGVVSAGYNRGISSFDYERIKAEEELDRNVATYATFAANTFAKAVVQDAYRTQKDQNSDVLQYRADDFQKTDVVREDADKRLLQYWGGQSRFKTEEQDFPVGETCAAVRDHLAAIRNSSVHYTAKAVRSAVDGESFIKTLFEKDFAEMKNVYAAKYYSNNVWMFYKVADISRLMSFLYQENAEVREAQIPAFNSVIKRKDMAGMIEKAIKKNSVNKIREPEEKEKYRASLYFVFKEIYYHAFILQPSMKDYFIGYIKKQEEELKKINEKQRNDSQKAMKNFADRILAVNTDKMTFGELCQTVMTDYNQQNQNRKSIESRERQEQNKKNGMGGSYKHFPLLLHQILGGLFLEYLKKEENLAFLREPEMTGREIELEGFQTQIGELQLYTAVKDTVEKDSSLLNWYVLAHFLMPKQLNHLIGDLKNYIQFTSSIDKRAKSVGNNAAGDTQQRAERYRNVVRILDFSLQYVGRVSNVITDYFADEDEYARFLAQFVNIKEGATQNTDQVTAQMLKDFCRKTVRAGKEVQPVGLYCDEANPIMNRNIAYAKMYCNDTILSGIYRKIEIQDIQKYYSKKVDLQPVFESGVCKNEAQQQSLCEFQKQKNHIELTELSIYTDLLNDFMAQLISWAYLRERDLMYFQLGLHYIRLFYNFGIPKPQYMELHGDTVNIGKGALLYQIAAMYTHDLPMYAVDADGKAKAAEKQGSAGSSIKAFVREYCKEDMQTAPTYNMGLELFEDVAQHDKISRFRNDIAHMRYLSATDQSIMELVSEIYRSFFIYDTKLKKSVSFVFKNILMRYGVIVDLTFAHASGKPGEESDKTVTLISIAKSELKSDQYTYKVPDKNGKTVEVLVDVRNENFRKQLLKLLEYKKVSKND